MVCLKERKRAMLVESDQTVVKMNSVLMIVFDGEQQLVCEQLLATCSSYLNSISGSNNPDIKRQLVKLEALLNETREKDETTVDIFSQAQITEVFKNK